MNARINTPDKKTVHENGIVTTRITLKRACNGCGDLLGDLDERDVDAHGNLTDVRGECPNCRPLVATQEGNDQ